MQVIPKSQFIYRMEWSEEDRVVNVYKATQDTSSLIFTFDGGKYLMPYDLRENPDEHIRCLRELSQFITEARTQFIDYIKTKYQ